jgi:hypothetical protein
MPGREVDHMTSPVEGRLRCILLVILWIIIAALLLYSNIAL